MFVLFTCWWLVRAYPKIHNCIVCIPQPWNIQRLKVFVQVQAPFIAGAEGHGVDAEIDLPKATDCSQAFHLQKDSTAEPLFTQHVETEAPPIHLASWRNSVSDSNNSVSLLEKGWYFCSALASDRLMLVKIDGGEIQLTGLQATNRGDWLVLGGVWPIYWTIVSYLRTMS